MIVSGKFRLIVAMVAVALAVLAGFWLSSERSRILSEKKEAISNLVEAAYSITADQQRMEAEGKVSHEEAQRQAISAIRALRYGDGNYVWINDMHPTMVMHPTHPQLDGKDLTDYRDPTGKALFVEMTATVQRSGSGFVLYMWPKPGKGTEPVPKMAYVKGFQPWGWVIGAGIYIDDVDSGWRSNAFTATGLGLICVVILIVFLVAVSRSVFG
jgi:methyl-accepting chemotaxis protein